MKNIFYLLILSSLLLGCNLSKKSEEKSEEKKEGKTDVYKSDNLLISQISKHTYEHTSYLDTESYGKVPCNGMIVQDGGEALVFDTPIDDEASQELIKWVEQELKSKIIAVVPTHYHEDNLGGLNEFHKQGIPSYALARTIEITKEKGYAEPQNAFEKDLELKVGNEKVYIEFLGEGHTCDNTVGYFPSEDILFGGCLVKCLGSGKGNLEEANETAWPQTIEKVKAKYPNAKYVVPGHGESGGVELLDYTKQLFEKK